MPGGDGTGPMGYGPMTGRGAGFCAGYPTPGYATFGGGRGLRGRAYGGGRGAFGRGRGYRHIYYATGQPGWMRYGGNYAPPAYGAATYGPAVSKEDEVQMLRDHANYFQSALEDINKRLNDLESGEE